MEELKPLNEILDYKYELYHTYKLMMKKHGLKVDRKRFEVIIRFDVIFMPYWLVLELINLGFDINE